jgi:hypothetical protein
MEKKMTLNDEVIGHIAKLVQLAILSGTDVVDHLRTIRLTESDGELFLTEECVTQTEQNIESMLSDIAALQTED